MMKLASFPSISMFQDDNGSNTRVKRTQIGSQLPIFPLNIRSSRVKRTKSGSQKKLPNSIPQQCGLEFRTGGKSYQMASMEMTRVHLFSKRSHPVGLQVVYAVRYTNGKVQEVATDTTEASSLDNTSSRSGHSSATLQLELGEYIVQVKPTYRTVTKDDQSHRVLKDVTFTTQLGRTVTLGSNATTRSTQQQAPLSNNNNNNNNKPLRKVVALVTKTSPEYHNVLCELRCFKETLTEEEERTLLPTTRACYTLHDQSVCHKLSLQTPLSDANTVLQRCIKPISGTTSSTSSLVAFGDLSFYQHLCQQPQCVQVDLQQIRCYYRPDLSIEGVFGIYKSTYANGTTVESQSMDHHQQCLGWRQDNEGVHVHLAKLVLKTPEEYVVDLQTGQQRGVLTVVTNLRTVYLGSTDDDSTATQSTTTVHSNRVVALAGVRIAHKLARISFVTECRNWEILHPLITLRALVQQQRAVPLRRITSTPAMSAAKVPIKQSPPRKIPSLLAAGSRSMTLSSSKQPPATSSPTTNTVKLTNKQKVVQGLIAHMPDDIFENVMTYLVPLSN